MNTKFIITSDSKLLVVPNFIEPVGDDFEQKVISLSEYINNKDKLEEYILTRGILLKNGCIVYSTNDMCYLPSYVLSEGFKLAKNMVTEYLDKGVSCISHDYPNKNQVTIQFSDRSYYLDDKVAKVRNIEISFGEYNRGDYYQTTEEGCHYMCSGSRTIHPKDIFQACMLFEVLKLTGYRDVEEINEMIFNIRSHEFKEPLTFTSIKELNKQQLN